MDLFFDSDEIQELNMVIIRLILASIHTAEGKPEAAIFEYTDVLEYDPEIFLVYINRGALYAKLGRFDQAKRDFEIAIRLEPKIAFTYIRRGDVFLAEGNCERAEADYLKCLELSPNNKTATQRLKSLRKSVRRPDHL